MHAYMAYYIAIYSIAVTITLIPRKHMINHMHDIACIPRYSYNIISTVAILQ